MKYTDLEIGDIIENKQIAEAFMCTNQGGIRKSLRTKTIVMIVKYDCQTYMHRKTDDVFYFVGQGKRGDQTLSRHNKSIAEASEKDFSIYLFEMFEKNEYTFYGEVALDAQPFIEKQEDEDKKLRDVYIFPMRKVQ